jgi:hypothetical protein
VSTPRTVDGRYRIARNVHASCRLDIMEEDADGVKLFLGVKKKGDSTVVVGTRIFLDSPEAKNVKVFQVKDVESQVVTVLDVSELDGKALHSCTGIQRETFPERRRQPRQKVSFPIRLEEAGNVQFTATQGNLRGLTLQATGGQKTLTRLVVDRQYTFTVRHKENDYALSGTIHHIRYDWKEYRHGLGISFAELTSEQEVVLSLLIDPNYTVPISTAQTIDTSQGKISD